MNSPAALQSPSPNALDRGTRVAGVVVVGAALFGSMLVLPLYFQIARGTSALTASLLMAPQGIQHQTRLALGGGGTSGELLQPLPASARDQLAGPLAGAFGHTFAWAAVLSLVSLVPALLLARAQTGRRDREPRVSQGAVAVGQ